ncbi:MAG: tetratricopeptide repeat protein, partial [Myxococcales bacterium]|nr:tetratricopeptide repeat protein [Myxococcales bacterium]
ALRRGDLDVARAHAREAEAIFAALPDQAPRGEPANLLALVEDQAGDYEAALAQARRALSLYEKGDEPLGAAASRLLAAAALISLGRLDEAGETCSPVLEDPALWPALHVEARLLLAEIALARGAFDDAEARLRAVEDQGTQEDRLEILTAIIRGLLELRRGHAPDPGLAERITTLEGDTDRIERWLADLDASAAERDALDL